MGNRITRTVLFAASALLSISAFGAGAARLGTLRNADWVVTNAWQAVSNKTHDLIIDMGQEASLPPNWSNVSNAAMNAVQSLQPAYDYSDSAIQNFSSTNSILSGGPYLKTSYEGATVGYSYSPGGEIVFNPSGIYVGGYSYLTQVAIISEETNGPLSSIQQYGGRFLTARQEMENYISTNNPSFVSAVLTAPLVGADPSDLSELAEYGSYGTVGAALLALIAGLAALKRRMTAAESAINEKADVAALPYALVVPGEWTYSEPQGLTNFAVTSIAYSNGNWTLYYTSDETTSDAASSSGNENDLSVVFRVGLSSEFSVTATRASLPGHLCDRANNLIDATTGEVTLTLPAYQEGKVRDLLVHVNLGDDGTDPYTVTVNFPSGETNTGFKVKGNASSPIPAPDAAGEWLYSFSECAPHKMAVALAQLQDATAGGS